jgi:hypothetical protein
MNDRITALAYNKLIKNKSRSKYGNQVTPYKNRNYHSKAEAEWAQRLDILQASGAILSWLPQAPKFPLTDEAKAPTYTADFLIFLHDGKTIVADCKGFDTSESKLKRAIVKDKYGIHVLIAWGEVQEAIDGGSHDA